MKEFQACFCCVAQEPKLSPYIPQMKENIARVLEIDVKQIGIKATSPEGLGFLGEKKGICCWAIASIREQKQGGCQDVS